MKHIINTILLFCMIVPLQADKNFDIALELARSSKIEKIIDNISEINTLTSEYILTTADKAVSKDKIKDYFKTQDILWKNYKGKELVYTIDLLKKNIVISNILPLSVSSLQKRLYKNNPNLPDSAIIDDKDLSIIIPLSSKVRSFISLIDSIDRSKVNLSLNRPVNSNKLWYKPDGNGGVTIYSLSNDTQSSLGKLSDKSDALAVIAKNKDELKNIEAKKGSIGYTIKDKKAIKYVYNGSTWINLSGEGGIKTVSTCTQKTLGALRYSDEDSCIEFCSKEGWKCNGAKNVKAPSQNGIYNSCYAIKQAKPSSKDGTYTIDPDGKGGDAQFKAYCDMTTDGGGWTLVTKHGGHRRFSIIDTKDSNYNDCLLNNNVKSCGETKWLTNKLQGDRYYAISEAVESKKIIGKMKVNMGWKDMKFESPYSQKFDYSYYSDDKNTKFTGYSMDSTGNSGCQDSGTVKYYAYVVGDGMSPCGSTIIHWFHRDYNYGVEYIINNVYKGAYHYGAVYVSGGKTSFYEPGIGNNKPTPEPIPSTKTIGSLVWQNGEEVKSNHMTWSSATNYCNNLVLDGSSNWRMPDKSELLALYRSHKDLTTNNGTTDYWTSKVYNLRFRGRWYVNYPAALHGGHYEYEKAYIRCVRNK